MGALRAAGIDVGKDHLDVGVLPGGGVFRVPNAPTGTARIVERLKRDKVRRVVLEAIGPYAACLIASLRKGGFEVGVVNPRRIKAFRDAEGRRAKTDKLDARLIARFAVSMTDALRPLPTENQLAAKALATRRRQIVEMIAMEKTRLKQAFDPLILDSHRAAIAALDAQRKTVEAELDRRLDADKTFARRRAILRSIPGIGPQAATTLLVEMPELGTLDRRAAASLAGLAPHPHQSGTLAYKTGVSGGRPCVRAALYMAALAAARANPTLKTAYRDMRAAGKPAKVALIAVARKLVVLANALVKTDSLYDPPHAIA